LDEVWYLDVAQDVRAQRLISRHHSFGKTPAEAADWAHHVDLRNAELIEQTRARADLVVQYLGTQS